MKKKYKLLGVLLGSVWFSLNETYGDFANLLNTIQSESLGQSAINKVTIERDATIKAISAMIGAVDKYKDKNAAEIEQFARIFSAILWSSPQASTTILIQKEDASQPAKLENSIYQEIQTSLANVLKSENSEVVWNSFAKNTESGSLNTALNSFRSIPGLSLGTTLKSNNVDSTAVVKDSQTRPADNTSTKTNTFSGITTLEYSGQNLSLYSDLISISVTVSQLNSSKDIESNKSLEIRVIGDAIDTTLSTQHLVVPRAKIDMSQVTNLTEVIVKHEDTESIKLPTTVVSLTAGSALKVIGASKLTSLTLTGAATSVPTWATDGSFTAADATLDLSLMSNLPTTLDLSGLNNDIKGLVIHARIIPTLPANQVTKIKLRGNATSVPTWATDGSFTAADATLDLSLMSNLPTTLDLSNLIDYNITNLILPETLIAVQNMPENINYLTANIPTLASIGAYFDENEGSAFPYHIYSITIVDSTTQSIQDLFLNSAENLKAIFFKKLDSVKSIGNGVCAYCTEVVDISLDGLRAVTSTGEDFLANFADYFTLHIDDVNPVSQKVIEAFVQNNQSRFGFLAFAGSATTLPKWAMDLSQIADLDTTLDMQLMTKLRSIDFLNLSENISTIIFPKNVSEIKNLPTTIEYITADIPTLTALGAYTPQTGISSFPEHIGLVRIVDEDTKTINDRFFMNCRNIAYLILQDLPSLKSIGNDFGRNFSNPEMAFMSFISIDSKESIGNNFFAGSRNLAGAGFEQPARSLRSIGSGCFQNSINLSSINFGLFTPNLTSIGADFCRGCANIGRVILDANSLPSFGTNAFSDVPSIGALTLTLNGIRDIELNSIFASRKTITNGCRITGTARKLPDCLRVWVFAAGGTLDLSELSGLDAQLDLGSLVGNLSVLKIRDTVRPWGILNSLTLLQLVGTSTSLPDWVASGVVVPNGPSTFPIVVGSMYAQGAKLDLSKMSGLSSSLSLTGLSEKIKHLLIDCNVQPTGISNRFLTLKLIGTAASIPSWAVNGSLISTLSGSELDLSEMSGMDTIDLSIINNIYTVRIRSWISTKVIVPAGLGNLVSDGLSNVELVGFINTLPSWAINGTIRGNLNLSRLSFSNSRLDLSEMNRSISFVTFSDTASFQTVVLPESVIGIANLPTTVQSLTSNIQVLASIGGAYGQGSFRDHIQTLFIKDSNIRVISSDFLNGATGLVEVTFQNLDNLEGIEANCLAQCPNLYKVTLGSLNKLSSIGDNFLANTTNLNSLYLNTLESIRFIGSNGCLNTPNLRTLSVRADTAETPVTIAAIGPQIANNLNRLNISGTASSVPSNAVDGSLTATNATLDLSGMTGLGAAINLSSLNTDITTVKVPTTVTQVTALATVTVELANGHSGLSSIVLTGTAASIPSWANNSALTASNATLDLSGMTGLGATLDLSNLNSDIRELVINSQVEPTNLLDRFSKLTLTGAAATVLTWATDGSLTTSNATLDLSGMTGLGATLDLSNLNSDITTVKVPTTVTQVTVSATVTSITGVTRLVRINLIGTAASIPSWINNAALTAPNAALDLSGMTGLGAAINLSSLNTDITTVKVPTTVTQVTALATVTVELANGHSGLSSIVLTGTAASIPSWANNSALTASNATLDLSGMTGLGAAITVTNTDITTVNVPTTVTQVTVPATVTSITGVTGLVRINLTSTAASIPSWINNSALTTSNATLDLSAMTGLAAAITVTNTDITTVNVPTTVTQVTVPATVTVQLANGHSGLSRLVLTGTAASIPNWANNSALTASNATLDLSGMTGLAAAITVTNTDITTVTVPTTVTQVTVPATVTSITGVTGLVRINLTGTSATVPTWATDGSITTSNGTLDLSGMTGLGSSINLSSLNTDITSLVINANVQPTNISDRLSKIKLTGTTQSVPAWATNGSITTADATLDLSGLTSLLTTLNLNGLHSDIKNLMCPEAVTRITNFPSTITSLTSNVPALLSTRDSNYLYPLSLTSLSIVDSTTTTLPDDFLNGAAGALITSLDLSGLTAVKTIGHRVCSSAPIRSINLSGLKSVTSIGADFLLGCTDLTSIDLSAFISVTSINNRFLKDCSKLESLTLSSSSKVFETLLSQSPSLNYQMLQNSPITKLNAQADTNGTLSTNTIAGIIAFLPNGFAAINLKGNNQSVPTWVNNTSITQSNAILDLTEMTNIPSFSLSSIQVSKFKTLQLSSSTTANNTSGWSSTNAGRTWTRQ